MYMDIVNDRNYLVYVYEDPENKYAYIGLTRNLIQRHKAHKYGGKKPDSVCRYFLDIGMDFPLPKVVEENLTQIEARTEEGFWVEEYRKNGWNIINRAKTGRYSSSVGSGSYVILDELKSHLLKEAKKYKNRAQYMRECPSHYYTCLEMGWLEDFFGKPERRRKGYWNIDKCINAAKECKTREEFFKKYPRAFDLLKEANLLDELLPISKPPTRPKKEERKKYRAIMLNFYDPNKTTRENAIALGIPKSSVGRIAKELKLN